MAEVIRLVVPEKPRKKPKPKTYTVDVAYYPGNLTFTVNDIRIDPNSLRTIADELEKIAQIIRTDVVTGVV